MKLVDFSIKRPVSVFIFAVAAVVFGLVAFSRLATDLLPDITYPSLTVRTGFEGAAHRVVIADMRCEENRRLPRCQNTIESFDPGSSARRVGHAIKKLVA